jgi:hypothetical protein
MRVRGADLYTTDSGGPRGEEQCQLRFLIHIRDENGFSSAGRESDERGYLDVIEQKCPDRPRKVAS